MHLGNKFLAAFFSASSIGATKDQNRWRQVKSINGKINSSFSFRALTSIKCVFQVEPDIPQALVSCSPESMKNDSYSRRTGLDFAVKEATYGDDSNLTDDYKSSLAIKYSKTYKDEHEHRKACDGQPVTPYYTVAVSNVQPCQTEQISSRKDSSNADEDSSVMRRFVFSLVGNRWLEGLE